MADFTISTRNQIIDWLVGKADPSPVAAARYLALFDGDPQGAGTEVTSTIRTAGRIEITGSMATASGGSASNSTELDFGNAAPGSSGTQFDYLAIFDASSGGNLVASDVLNAGQQTVTENNPVKIKTGALIVSIT